VNATIWIKDPYPFRYDEYDALEQALKQSYGYSLVYLRDWPVDHVSVDGITKTACNALVITLKVTHQQHALLDKKYRGSLSNYCKDLEIVIQGPNDDKPAWAEQEVKA
jgi:hypothetical protein